MRLTSYPGTVRQLVVTGLGREEPTVIITNEEQATLRNLITQYARRVTIEQRLAEIIRAFCAGDRRQAGLAEQGVPDPAGPEERNGARSVGAHRHGLGDRCGSRAGRTARPAMAPAWAGARAQRGRTPRHQP